MNVCATDDEKYALQLVCVAVDSLQMSTDHFLLYPANKRDTLVQFP